MKHSLATLSAAALLASSSVAAHGFLSGIGKLSPSDVGQVRNYNLIDHQIDDLRSPLSGNSAFCRGAPRAKPVALSLTEGGSLTVTQAFSLGAQHIGPCALEIVDANDHSKSVRLL